MKDVQLVLRMYLGDDAPEGPGWYVYASGENPLIAPIKVAPQAADILAEAFERVVGAFPDATIHALPKQIVQSGNNLVRQKIRQELEFAEAQALRIKALRQSLQALEDASGTVETSPERQE